jgi:superfamily II RNA helicase
MVQVCLSNYNSDDEIKYGEYFKKYHFELSNFQKHAIESIVTGNHVLVCAPTGSGKTLVADFAIEYMVKLGKKVIYTSPIKALSNQKFYEFTNKYPDISFGLLTGDIKTNPEADVLIMTAEILLNKLYSKDKSMGVNDFDMNIEDDLGCVIMDEVHYINDESRGHVWEETIMRLPEQIQMVMLSATLDSPEKFAGWCENRWNREKKVYLTCEYVRQVPLTHYMFITCNNSIFKIIKDKDKQNEIRSVINKPLRIQTSNGLYEETNYFKMTKMLDLFANNKVYVKRQHILNEVCKYMVDNNMLPALCFVLSRKLLEECAKEVTVVLLEDDSKVPYIINYECEKILRKLPNYKEYLNLPEYINLVKLLEKGIAIHHAGVMPVFREMVEILYSKGYIKILFATETFSVGLNMPTKSVVFTDINKYDGNIKRMLYSHEYTQMAGRAGRRGIDTVGHVIHLNNLIRNIDSTNYKIMMNGKPPILKSKFKISYNNVLNDIVNNNNGPRHIFYKNSMIDDDINCEIYRAKYDLYLLDNEFNKYNMTTEQHIVEEYIDVINKRSMCVNKKRRECDKRIENLLEEYKYIENDAAILKSYLLKRNNFVRIIENKGNILDLKCNVITDILITNRFVVPDPDPEVVDDLAAIAKYKLTLSGKSALKINEVHSLIFSSLIMENVFDDLLPAQMVSILSCFTNINVCEELKTYQPESDDKTVLQVIHKINKMYDDYLGLECKYELNTGVDYTIHYDIINYVGQWCNSSTEDECKYVIQLIKEKKDISLGDFVKAILKINNICREMESIAEENGNIKLLKMISGISKLIIKYVATSESLYV